jgi:hypothetical protein
MRKLWTTAILTAAVMGIPAFVTAADQPAIVQEIAAGAVDVPVKKVMLFSSGVGYFQHDGNIHGDGSTELRFKTNQINDILKSLVLEDLDGGKVTTITYPSQDPLDKTLKSFQVDITANPPLADLLNQLRGAAVTVSNAGEKSHGVILGVEKKQKPVGEAGRGGVVEEAVLNLVSGGKIVSMPLDLVGSIELDDPQLQEELNKALVALASARDQDKKPVKINFAGTGDRRVRIGYVVETPIWKSSYRLILENDPKKQPAISGNLQGWAIVENQTDNDWNNVDLTLVSGRPISFVEDLYQSLYVPRPVVEPELYASLRPQTYAGAMDEAGKSMAFGMATTPAPANLAAQDDLRSQLAQNRAMLQGEQSLSGARGGLGGGGGGNMIDATHSISSLASAAEVGELFQFTVGNVSLQRQRSAMIPIITDPIEVERVSIYNISVLPRNPLNGARIRNTTGKHLLAGPVTVLDQGSYAGDAQIDNVPPGQERFLSYGVDLQLLVDATDNKEDSQLQTGKIVKGVLTVTNKEVHTQNYVAQNKSDHAKTLVVEHQRRPNWDLVDTDKPMETTDAVYRFKGEIAAGQKSTLKVTEQTIDSQDVALLAATPDQFVMYSTAGEIPKPVQDALSKAIQLKQGLADTQTQIDAAKAKLADITAEQNRIRENMRTVEHTSQYYTRLMTKLNDQESDIEKTQTQMDDLQKTLANQRRELETYLANLNVG